MKYAIDKVYKHKCLTLLTIAMLLLNILRISLHADVYDEVFNLSVSYRVALGQLPYYQCWEAYQGGDLFLSPFLWLYINLLGTSSGIVLFSRCVYLLWLAGCSFIVYKAVSYLLPKIQAFVIALSCIFFSIYGLFYLWYDTVAVLLLLAGSFSVYIAIINSSGCKWGILGAFLHGLMILAYPSMILITLFCFLLELISCVKNHNWRLLLYFLAGYFCALAVGAAIVLHVGIENFILGIRTIMSYRHIASDSSSLILIDILKAYIAVNKSLIIFGVVYIPLGILAFKRQKLLRPYLLMGLLLPMILCLGLNESYRGLLNYASFIGLWAPILYVIQNYFCKKGEESFEKLKREKARKLLIYVWLPSLLSTISIALSTVYAQEGPIKAWEGMFPSALVSLVLLTVIWQSIPRNNSKVLNDIATNAVGLIFCCCLLVNSYTYVYLNAPYITLNDPVSRHGVFAGIRVKDSMLEWESVKPWLQPYIQDNETILVSFVFNPIYLMTDLRPLTPSVESPTYYLDGELQWEMSLKYFSLFNEYPDIMILSKTDMEDSEIQQLLAEKYSLADSREIGGSTATIFIQTKN